MKRILGFRISGSSLIECVVAMVILFGILSMMFTGFSIAGDYIVKGAALKDASSNALRQINTASVYYDKDLEVDSLSGITAKDGTVILDFGSGTETIDGTYYTSKSEVQDITSEKSMYYTVFKAKKATPVVPPPAVPKKLMVNQFGVTTSLTGGYYRLEIEFDGENIPRNKKNNISVTYVTDGAQNIAKVSTAADSNKAYVNIVPKGVGTMKFKLRYGGEETDEIAVTIT